MLKELYIVRHGHPQPNTGLLYDRVPGPALSDIGRAEAHVTAMFLLNRGIEQVFTSPLERTLGTARIITAELCLPLTVEEALAEHRSTEKFDEVKARLRAFLSQIDARPWSSVALVTHGSPIKALLLMLSNETLDLSKHIYPNGNHVPTAGVWHASRDLFGAWQLNLVFKPVVSTPATHVPI
jgi:2,3-bisphosphoglycerate-dependent phosphoglycerate mutase